LNGLDNLSGKDSFFKEQKIKRLIFNEMRSIFFQIFF